MIIANTITVSDDAKIISKFQDLLDLVRLYSRLR